jgi:hypothetical protein
MNTSDLRLIGAVVLPIVVALILLPGYRKVVRFYLRAMRPW